jgi:serine O-acetyltransferase
MDRADSDPALDGKELILNREGFRMNYTEMEKMAEKLAEKAYHSLQKGMEKAEKLTEEVRYDVSQIKERDPAATSSLEVALLYSGFHAVTVHRLTHLLYQKGYKLPARALSQLVKTTTGIEIHPGATIGKGLFIDHGTGVVIGETAEIGDNCTIYQGVTLGGTGKHCGKRHPTLGDDVMVGAGAKVLGPFRVGDHAKIAAGAVVLNEIPANATAVGIPARVVRKDGHRVEEAESGSSQDLDQIHMPDPVAKEVAELRAKVKALENRVAPDGSLSADMELDFPDWVI